ncbi:YafY family protein [Cellulomonas sp. P24]|uniref:helix-turn-helix transcriptional regulator n=1 Tax=Cellulomonas sp. P24 TaxID=2885206 RepID=UPI00216AE6F7|nr:YafY family protein [Cellulomonas sp. P24]MCR6493576.1 YafY family transcriptional regulator [Cellulomonas sp. P24]
MTRPTARVLALLEILQAGGTRTVGDLAAQLGVDERTVRRYVVHLADLDVPVESVRGRYGGYRLAPGYRMPPLMLTDDEALAVLWALAAGRRAGVVTTPVAAVESAAAKVRRVLPVTLGRRLDALLTTAEFTVPGRPVIELETTVLLALAEAVRDRRPVAISYTSPNKGRSERTVHPYGIVAHSGRWYVTGADSASGETRTFRLDRIVTVELLAGSFDHPDGFDPADRVLTGLAEAPHRHTVSLRVQATPMQVRSQLPAGLATVHEIAHLDGWVRVQLHAERLDWLPAVLAGLGFPFTIEHPDALRGLVRSLAERLASAADTDTDTIHTGELPADTGKADRDPA